MSDETFELLECSEFLERYENEEILDLDELFEEIEPNEIN